MIATPEPESAASVVARLVALEPGFYAFTLTGEAGAAAALAGLALPAVQICAAPDDEGRVEIADATGRANAWLGGGQRVLFVSVRRGGTALVTGFLARDPEGDRLALDISRIDAPGAAAAPLMTLDLGGPAAATDIGDRVALDILVHIRGRGDVRFLDTPWAGRLGPGLWIEALALFPHSRAAAAAIEYKGLTANGAETPWLASGMLCGFRGQQNPLIGFAVRQKAGATGAFFDCECTGYFASGATAGPARNGAPCRSAVDNDPLEGVQLRITPRPPRPRP